MPVFSEQIESRNCAAFLCCAAYLLQHRVATVFVVPHRLKEYETLRPKSSHRETWASIVVAGAE